MPMKHPILLVATLGMATPAPAGEPSFSVGLAETIDPGLIECGDGSRVGAVGRITAEDGTVWTVPAATNFETATKAADLYNDCSGTENVSFAEFDLESVPVLDAGGNEEFTAFVFADNYFELYVNGQLIAVDPVIFTPFNSSVIRFKADRPVSLAVLGVDWEENLGLGSERGRGSDYALGDAGIVARIQGADGNEVKLTDQRWKAQTFYVSPLADRSCLVTDGESRDSSDCSNEPLTDPDTAAAAHWPLPNGWEQPGFDDSAWPAAVEYSNDRVGVDNKPAYTNFPDVFDAPSADASFIWTSNLVLDNLVLLRTTID